MCRVVAGFASARRAVPLERGRPRDQSARFLPHTVELLGVIASELGTLGNRIAIEGHTDSRPYALTNGYTNWELSADRANAARRTMEQRGLRAGQIDAVRGFADTRPRDPADPLDPRNRRISIVVQSGS